MAKLMKTALPCANLRYANLQWADLSDARMNQAILSPADLDQADLSRADLSGANLRWANLTNVRFVKTNLSQADLTLCQVFGISVWNPVLTGAIQTNLRITTDDEPEITVDDLEVAQFIYLMLHNERVRQVIDTITSKVVLILGRFTKPRKRVLDALRDELRRRNYLPVVFDFEKPANRDLTETISTLAHMARFVIADLTDAKSIPQELSVIIPNLPSVAIQPLIHVDDTEYAMFEHWQRYPWVLETYRYESLNSLLAAFKEHVIDPAERCANDIAPLKH
jgi:Pentapeptide repeats (8 copies)